MARSVFSLHRADDFICSPVQGQRLHLRIPCSKLLLIEEAGHMICM